MSDLSQGPGWWIASDGRWYPPELHPDYVAPPPLPPAGPPPLPSLPPPGPPQQSGPWPAPSSAALPGPAYGSPYGWSGTPAAPGPVGVPAWPSPAPVVTSGLALTALILSILWIGGLGSLSAVIFGFVALAHIRSSQGRRQGRGLATAGVVIGLVGLVGAVALYATAGTVTPRRSNATAISPESPKATPASAAVVQEVTGVTAHVRNLVGVPSQSLVVPPTVQNGQPHLQVDGKPGAVFVGAVFCPYCAAERWSIIMAFSRFGTFSHLLETTSSPWDVYPATATFSFHGATYSSRYVGLAISEHAGNDLNGPGTSSQLDPLTQQEANLWQTYDNPEGFPFLDIGNRSFVLSPSFSPAILAGLDQVDIASGLSNPSLPRTQAIVGAANYITAAICAITNQKPASVCATAAVINAGQAMKLSSGESLTAVATSGH